MSRPRKKNVGIYLLAAILVALVGLSYLQTKSKVIEKSIDHEYGRRSIKIADETISVYLAESEEEKRLGLSIFEELEADRGMLFEYDQPGKPAFWMKDMSFDIDMVWIRNDIIVGITPNVSRYSQSARYIPEQEIDTVLEVNAGYCKRNKIEVGDSVE